MWIWLSRVQIPLATPPIRIDTPYGVTHRGTIPFDSCEDSLDSGGSDGSSLWGACLVSLRQSHHRTRLCGLDSKPLSDLDAVFQPISAANCRIVGPPCVSNASAITNPTDHADEMPVARTILRPDDRLDIPEQQERAIFTALPLRLGIVQLRRVRSARP